jgi:hypothetical protein
VERSVIGQHRDAFDRRHREMVIAFGADLGIGQEFLAKDDLAALLALHPQTAGDLVPLCLGFGNLWLFFFFEYRHGQTLQRDLKTLAQPPRIAPVGKMSSDNPSGNLYLNNNFIGFSMN